jgi:GT2 family glycosyltransferase
MSSINIAVLLTCFNRKEKTIACLKQLIIALNSVEESISLKIYLTDDGSTDGTGEAVKLAFPDVHILKGNGNLYWAGGMRNSWETARKGNYDAYLLLNDDTDVREDFLATLLKTHDYCVSTFKAPGIYIGSTKDAETQKLSYGGAKLTNKFWFKYHFIEPTEEPQQCDLGNANIMWVPKEVVEQIGTLSKGYIHGVADYDYTLMAKKAKIPVLIAPGYLGTCTDDHSNIYTNFHTLTFKERIAKLKNPIGLDLKSNLLLQKRFFPLRVPFVLFSAGLKVLLPKVYTKRFNYN